MSTIILGIESSCDDTSAAIIKDEYVLSNVIANQDVHKAYGGVIPELASRAHQQNIIPVIDRAIKQAGITKNDIDGVAFTNGPGLLGSLLVGSSFAKSFALGMNIPLIDINHLQGHVLSHFIKEKGVPNKQPKFPFLCLLVSGGNSQIIVVKDYFEMEIIGKTIDDAAGEAFDKCAKVIGLPYPGGPMIDKYAKEGNANKFLFTKPRIKNFDYSFSGLKTAFLYFIRDRVKENPNFVKENRNDICASIQKTIVDILLHKVELASEKTGIKQIGLAGGVSANSGLRQALTDKAKTNNWDVYIPKFKFTTDNAAMIAITGYYKYLNKDFAKQDIAPIARLKY
ncbi:MAG: tRNA (adenosine(37)-N6)-threonylcarbamoyltransferase complex transferase subunit TsaD [Bacteroidota bacterium]|nr:tRNA (adenosine(37)-N6)-threonylcarbamoyltransferase complex transferase subunit TsaD [Bacteroidota bacterium]